MGARERWADARRSATPGGLIFSLRFLLCQARSAAVASASRWSVRASWLMPFR